MDCSFKQKLLLIITCLITCNGMSITVSNDNCEGTQVNFDLMSEPVYLNYYSDPLDDICVYEFSKSGYDYTICVQALEFSVFSAETKVEYHEIVYYRSTADEIYDQNDSPTGEFCVDYSKVFIAVLSPNPNGYDRVRLKIYAKEEESSSSRRRTGVNTGLIIGLPLGIVGAIFFIACIGIIAKRRSINNMTNSNQRFVYHTANPSTVTYQSGSTQSGRTAQPSASYKPVPVHQQGGYNVYPTQVAYPVGQGQASGTNPQPGQFQQYNTENLCPSEPPPPYPGV